MSAAPHHQYTVEAYSSFERGADTKHEHYQGEIFALVGASPRHAILVANLVTALSAQLRDRPCLV